MIDDALRTSLLELAYHFEKLNLPVILGGGYGLYLRQLALQDSAEQTVLDRRSWPAPRSTEDLDVFLKMSIVADDKSMEAIAATLKTIGYVVISGSEHWQFRKLIDKSAEVKIDLLSGPISSDYQDKVKRNAHRLRPKSKSVGLHAHLAEEALGLEEGLIQFRIDGELSNSKKYSAAILIPHPFTYLLMKLHAFKDRVEDERKDLGQHHALDVFRTVAMMSESDLDESINFANEFSQNKYLASAQEIAKEYFATPTSLGLIRIRQHPLYPKTDNPLSGFLSALHRIIKMS